MLIAHTDAREGRHGCGKLEGDKKGISKHCDQQNIKSFENWKEHYKKVSSTHDKFADNQCAFDMTMKSAAKQFTISLQANIYLQKHSAKYAFRNNELRIEAWKENDCKNIPIEAFFYLSTVPGSVAKANKFQNEFYKCSGYKVPIFALNLPIPR